MTSRPRLETNGRQVVGLLALALFGLFAAVFLTADFANAYADPGFGGAPITASLGYAMFNLGGAAVPAEGFLVAFEIVDLVLVAALVGAVMLARREGKTFGFTTGAEESESSSARTDGGRPADGDEGGDR